MLFLKKNRQQERSAALWSTDSVKAAILIIYTHQTQKETYLKTIKVKQMKATLVMKPNFLMMKQVRVKGK